MLDLDPTRAAVPPRDAATLVVVRDGAAGLEVFCVERQKVGFLGGAVVFPGGKVDASDGSPEQAARRELREEVAIELAPDAELIPFARWITPLGLPTRFDTWFFLAHADTAQGADRPTVDDSEIVEARWAEPATVLADGRPLAFPTRKQLERLAGYRTAAAALAASRGARVEPILPEIVTTDGAATIVIPERT